MTWLGTGLIAATLAALVAAPAALAREASGPEVRELASQAAAGDGRALAELRDVDRVDERAFTLADPLDAEGQGLRSRLRSLAARPVGASPDAAATRGKARGILADDRFHEPSFPRPLQPFFAWLATALEPVVDKVDALITGIVSLVPGGGPVGLTVLAIVLLAGSAALSSRALHRRSHRQTAAVPREAAHAGGPSPPELERAAADAEHAGDLSLAVRLLFRAGLLRLDERGAIRLHPALTTAAIANRLQSREFAELAASFEEVAYGGRAAEPSDVQVQRSGWRRVLGDARR